MQLKGFSGQVYILDAKPFTSGGEGDIYSVTNDPTKIAKIYHSGVISDELEEKLKIMVKNPPSESVLSQVAWPVDILYVPNRKFCGFIMPKLDIKEELLELYKYPQTSISTRNKILVAENICAVISEVHKAGYVFGDFNPCNIGVSSNGKVAFLDTNSYHIFDYANKKTYRCKVCLDGYVAPELLIKCKNYPTNAYALAPLPTFTKETDNFALAIHIFKLLMNGFTPYNGIKETERVSQASPGVGNKAIERDNYCFKPGNKPQALAVPTLDVLPYEIIGLFTRAFIDGRIDPKLRPNAIEWYNALLKYENDLQTCSTNITHQYKKGLASCPWCETDERYANSITPPIQQRPYSQPVMPPSTFPPSGKIPVTPTKKNGKAIWIVLSVILVFVATIGVINNNSRSLILDNTNNSDNSYYQTSTDQTYNYQQTQISQDATQSNFDATQSSIDISKESTQTSLDICNNFIISDINVSMTTRSFDGSYDCRETCDGLNCVTYYCELSPFGTLKVTNQSNYSFDYYNIGADDLGSGVQYTFENYNNLINKKMGLGKIMDSQGNCDYPTSENLLKPGETQTNCLESWGGWWDSFGKNDNPKILQTAQIGAKIWVNNPSIIVYCPIKTYSVNVGPTDWHDYTK